MSEQNKQTALKFLKAMGENNAAVAAECLAPDAFTLATGFSKFAGVRHRDTMLNMIEAFKQMVPGGLQLEFKSVIADGDSVAVEAEGHAVTSEGKPYGNQYCFVVYFKDGKVAQVNEYFCSKLAEEVLWPLVENQQHLLPKRRSKARPGVRLSPLPAPSRGEPARTPKIQNPVQPRS